MNNLMVIDSVQIHQDKEGRYSLNDFHRVAGGNPKDQPSNFLQTQKAIDLVDEISNSWNSMSLPVATKEGRNGGTYACKEIIYAYAMWVSAKFHLKVIRTFDAVVTGKLQSNPLKPITVAARLLPTLIKAAKSIGCDNNAAVISASQAVKKLTDVDLLETLGQTHLISQKQENFYTPTELGKELNISARQVNLLLAEAGMQLKRGEVWEATEAGKEFARIYDTGKKHGSGVPITQIKWSINVLQLLNKEKEAA